MSANTIKELSTKRDTERPVFESMLGIPSEQKFGEWIMINEIALRERVAELVNEIVKERVDKFLQEKEIIEFRRVNNVLAEKEITNFILQMKEKGILKISILDIVSNLNLPSEQIERIMTKFEKEKRVFKAYK